MQVNSKVNLNFSLKKGLSYPTHILGMVETTVTFYMVLYIYSHLGKPQKKLFCGFPCKDCSPIIHGGQRNQQRNTANTVYDRFYDTNKMILKVNRTPVTLTHLETIGGQSL